MRHPVHVDEMRVCEWCGSAYRAHHKSQRYCRTGDCKRQAESAREKQRVREGRGRYQKVAVRARDKSGRCDCGHKLDELDFTFDHIGGLHQRCRRCKR